MGYGNKLKVIQSPGGIIGDMIYEEVDLNGIPHYAVKRTGAGPIKIEPHLELSEGFMYTPINPPIWVLPPPPQPYGKPEDLFAKIRDYVYQHIDFEQDVQYDIITAWIMATWVTERFDSVGYLWATGPKNSGKTRVSVDVPGQLVYRPLPSPSVSGASIYRAIEAFQPTFLLDEFEMYQKQIETKAEIIGVLNAGYRRGQVVLRTDKVVDGAPQLRGFRIFGFKSVNSIEKLPGTLGSRCITFIMSKATRKIKRMIDKATSVGLRAQLLQFRFDACFLPPLEDNPIDLPDGRLVEIYLPIVMMAPEVLEEKILDYARHSYNQTVEEERDTVDAQIFLIIIDLLKEEVRTKIRQSEIRDRINMGVPDDKKMGKIKCGMVLKNLGFDSTLNKERQREIIVRPETIARRAERYVVAEEREELDLILKKLYTTYTTTAKKDTTLPTLPNTTDTTISTYTTTREAQNKPLSPSSDPVPRPSIPPQTPSTSSVSSVSNVSNVLAKIERVLGVKELKFSYQGTECPLCRKQKIIIRYKIEFFDAKQDPVFVCYDCGLALIKRMAEHDQGEKEVKT